MKIYSKKNKENLSDAFSIHLIFPIIKWGTQPGNPWGNDSPAKYVNVQFNTDLRYRKDDTWWIFQLTLLGFGFSITKQNGY